MEHKCNLCGHTWKNRADYPVSCPRCKRYDWNIRKKEKKELKGVKKDGDNNKKSNIKGKVFSNGN
jgi:endogenous inhibitor of DNA gyrase (YacG/DUF329 family)